MLDRLIAVPDELPRRLAELPVEVDRGAERDDASEDAGREPGGGLGEVALEAERILECLHDRLDALADPADRRLGTIGLVGTARPNDERLQLAHCLLELVPGEALVAEHELSCERLALEQGETRLPLGGIGGDEIEVDDRSVRAREQDEAHAPKEARMRRRVAEPAVGSELRAVDRVRALAAGKGRRIEQKQRVVEAGQLAGNRSPEDDELGRALGSARCRSSARAAAERGGAGASRRSAGSAARLGCRAASAPP